MLLLAFATGVVECLTHGLPVLRSVFLRVFLLATVRALSLVLLVLGASSHSPDMVILSCKVGGLALACFFSLDVINQFI